MPVYFTQENDDLLDIYEQVKTAINSDKAGSAAEGTVKYLITALSAMFYH